VDTRNVPWEPTSVPGIDRKLLYRQTGFSDAVFLERWSAEADPGEVSYAQGAELFVLEGEFADEAGAYPAGCWLRLPMGFRHHPVFAGGCTIYIKTAGLPYLKSAVT
jgi:ChrR Cupin-like domain